MLLHKSAQHTRTCCFTNQHNTQGHAASQISTGPLPYLHQRICGSPQLLAGLDLAAVIQPHRHKPVLDAEGSLLERIARQVDCLLLAYFVAE